MEDTSHRSSVGPAPWNYSTDADELAMPVVLVVEDNGDIRDLMSTLLEMAGFVTVPCETAEAGLNALREQAVDLILTDYSLPRHSGLWLLEQAEAEGLIQGTPVLIVTAHPELAAGRGYEIIQKPFDLDDLIERVRYLVEGDGPRRRRAAPAPGAGDGNGRASGGTPNCPVELILYVSSQSPQSSAAVEHVKKVLSRLPSSRVRLSVHDLSLDSSPPHVTPGTIVRKTAGPRTFILGHITSPEALLELLADCETGEG
jgi:DNA-binding response OmpR family regulator